MYSERGDLQAKPSGFKPLGGFRSSRAVYLCPPIVEVGGEEISSRVWIGLDLGGVRSVEVRRRVP